MFFFSFNASLFGQELQKAPLNPEFQKYQSNLYLKLYQSTGGHSLGLIPEPILPNFVQTTPIFKQTTVFASKYDLRTAGPNGTSLVTSVKDQGNCGACWSFSTMGAIEGYAKKFGLGDYDLSENNIKECHGFLISACDGGNTSMASAYLARKSGPISELNDPYNDKIIGCRNNIYPEFWVSDIRYLPNDPSVMKQSILDYGAITSSFYYGDSYFNSTNNTYYSTGQTTTNHEVLIVGWDDNKVTAGGTGAWIAKNSWGPSWGDGGYFYISYNDSKINTTVSSIRNIEPRVLNSSMFDYDQLGVMSAYGYSANDAYGLIKFSTGSKNYTLKRLSTFMQSGPGTVRFEVYSSFNGSTLSNLLGTITDKTCDLPGYYTFDLSTPIQLAANTDFYVKVYYNTTGYNYPIPVETASSGYATPVIESGKCWISSTGTNWTAFGSDQSVKADLTIKAYGEYSPCIPPTTQTSGFKSLSEANNSMTLNWVRGNGNAVVVVARAGSPVNIDPFGESTLTANSSFGSGTQLGTGNFVVYNGTGNAVNLTSLASGTTYYFAFYEYNLTSNCYMTPAMLGNATTKGLPPYCTAGSSTTLVGYISRVRLNEIDQTTTSATNGYEDYTSKIASMQLGVNSTITINRSASYVKDSLLIWVDWNGNGDLSNAGEMVYASPKSGSTYTATFAPPVGATIGMTRMRIRLLNNTYLPNITPCGISYYGDVQDYTIYVTSTPNIPIPPVANNATNILQTNCMAYWGTSSIATGYKLDVAYDYGFTSFLPGYQNKDVGNVTSYGVVGLNINTTYYYRVRAYNASGESPNSNIIAFTTLPDPPTAPVANAAANILQTSFNSGWSSPPTATGYKIDLSTNIGFSSFVTGYSDKDVGNVSVYNLTGLTAKTIYYYRVRAYNTGGSSNSSNIVTLTTLTNPAQAPVSLKSGSCNNFLTLHWPKSTDGDVVKYRIYGGLTSAPTVKIDSTNSATDTLKTISGLIHGQLYYFRIAAVNYDGPVSPFSNEVSEIIKTGVIPAIKAKWGDVLICPDLGDSIVGYQWLRNGTAIVGATTQNYVTNKQAGQYSVVSTDLNGCQNTSNVLTITGTKSLSVFPNPTSETFSLKINDITEGKAYVSIINSSGIIVKEFQTSSLNDSALKEISVHNLNPGVYIVKVLVDNADLYYTKVVVTK